MKHWQQWGCAIALALNITILTPITSAAYECGLSCCVAAGVDGVGSAEGFNVTMQYERMDMKTLKEGTSTSNANAVLQKNLAAKGMMAMYSVPTKMVMQKFSTNIAYRMDDKNAFLLTVPYVINDMDMDMGMNKAGGIQVTKMKMNTISGLGDASLIYLRDMWKDTEIRTRKRISLGVGIKAPTGRHTSRDSNGELVHMMMQAGSGSWDGMLLANASFGFLEHEDGGALWFINPSVIYQFNGRNDLGYQHGNRLNIDVSTRYRATSKLNLKLDFNGVWTQSDSSNGQLDSVSPSGRFAYQAPMMSMLDNVNNTGIKSLFITPGITWLATTDLSFSAEYKIPLSQNVTGTQIVTDQWYFIRANLKF